MAHSVLTVAQLNLYIRTLLEGDSRLAYIRVNGEISNLKIHYASGHIYFTLKDSMSAVKCVMFKSNASRLKIALKDGMKVVCIGRVSVYERDGSYQLYVEDIISDGEGDLMLAFEKLKQRLETEGLFDISRKKKLPEFPKNIAVITSDTGAAVRDIFNVISRRWPLCNVKLYPALVQGEGAPQSLISAMDSVILDNNAEVIIIGRGGGSIEDLWAFNDELLVRRIAECSIPVISAVGHETDFTICDFVADMRAPTPSAAAEIAVPDQEEIKASVLGYENLIKMRVLGLLNLNRTKLEKIMASEEFKTPAKFISERRFIDTERFADKIQNNFIRVLSKKESEFSLAATKVDSLSPLKTMMRGYAAASINKKSITSVKQISNGESITLRFVDGSAKCKVEEVR